MEKTSVMDRVAKMSAIVALAALSGVAGAAGNPVFAGLLEQAETVYSVVDTQLRDHPEMLIERTYDGEGVITLAKDEVEPGPTLIQGLFPGGAQIRLIDAEGRELHRWDADFFRIFPDAEEFIPAHRIPASKNHYFIQGMAPLRDGSIVLNFGHLGAARLDRCSQPVWRLRKPAHHAVTANPDGTYWIPSHKPINETPAIFLPDGVTKEDVEKRSHHTYFHDTVMLLGADGKVLREFSLMEAVYEAGLENAMFDSARSNFADLTHLNEIEVVTPELAARIDGVEAGDLLLSLRDFHMIVIMDKDTGKILWNREGPWVMQHDPDIMADGTIELFNNRPGTYGNRKPGSQIVRFDPASGKTEKLFPKGQDDYFSSEIMGAHQLLANGNRLITESMQGRMLEVTETGKVVWDYRLPFDDTYSSLISLGIRLPSDFYEGVDLKCPNANFS
ncbi:arylsulfotransferase family protein [Sphingomicrobium nitratireducens]|uniref:arylsulfotransferase family protein n=1 Tax=Sphingomicrobium nitratireducens TaxID=2964666 RepID=UPI00223EC406|nr:arylsulfotransferase family protein [Sphingomicrobium nitratireducens]